MAGDKKIAGRMKCLEPTIPQKTSSSTSPVRVQIHSLDENCSDIQVKGQNWKNLPDNVRSSLDSLSKNIGTNGMIKDKIVVSESQPPMTDSIY